MKYKQFFSHLLKENATPQWSINVDADPLKDEEVYFVINQKDKSVFLEDRNGFVKLISLVKSNPTEYGNIEDFEYFKRSFKEEVESDADYHHDMAPDIYGKPKLMSAIDPDQPIDQNTVTYKLSDNSPKNKLTPDLVKAIQFELDKFNKIVKKDNWD